MGSNCTMRLEYPLTSDFLTTSMTCPLSFKKILSQECGLSVSQVRILLCLDRFDDVCTGKTLASRLSLSVPTVASALSSLETSGLVRRKEDPEDRRRNYVELTEIGRKQIQDVDEVLSGAITSLWGDSVDMLAQDVLLYGAELMDSGMGRPMRSYEGGDKNYDSSYVESYFEAFYQFGKILGAFNLTRNEFRLLFELYGKGHGERLGSLSSTLIMRLSEITSVSDRLVERDLVSRSRDKLDRRSVRIKLTEEGEALICKAAESLDSAFCHGFGSYDVAYGQRCVFLDTAARLAEAQRKKFNPYH